MLTTPAHGSVQGCTEADAQLERQDREAFVDFLLGVLDMDPATRWTPRQVQHRPWFMSMHRCVRVHRVQCQHAAAGSAFDYSLLCVGHAVALRSST